MFRRRARGIGRALLGGGAFSQLRTFLTVTTRSPDLSRQLLNAFDMPRLHYDSARKIFSLYFPSPVCLLLRQEFPTISRITNPRQDAGAKALHAGPQAKVDMFRER